MGRHMLHTNEPMDHLMYVLQLLLLNTPSLSEEGSKPNCPTLLQVPLAFDPSRHDTSPDQDLNPAHTGSHSRPGCRASRGLGFSVPVQAETEGMLAPLLEE